MTSLKKNIWVGVKEYTLITLGVLMYVVGWIIFLIPNNMIGGGVTGLGSIVQYATNGVIKIGYTYFVVNAGLLVGQGIFPQEIIQTLALDNGKLMCTIMGGIMVGIGIGMSMSQGGSTGVRTSSP